MKLVTEKQIARTLNVRYDTIRHWVAKYRPGQAQGVYHFGRSVRIDRDRFIETFPAFLDRKRAR